METASSAPLILASTSTYRRELLLRLGLVFRCETPAIEENDFKARQSDPRELARELARAKAANVAERFPGAIVIGSDQVAWCNGKFFNKPGTFENAQEQLAALAGHSHYLYTAVAVVQGAHVREAIDTTRLHMRPLDPETIARYVTLDRPLDCAGSYKLEQRGITLFERIESADHTAITGLPLLALSHMLRAFGYVLP